MSMSSHDRHFQLIENMADAFAYHQVVTDGAGRPVDYLFLEVNRAFELMTGLLRQDIIGRKVGEVLPDIRKDPFDWIGTYGRLAAAGGCISFENYSQALGRYYDVSAYSYEKGFFATVFRDITGIRKREEELRFRQLMLSRAQRFAAMGIWEYTLADGRLRWSAECEKVFGLAPGEFAGGFEDFLSFVHPADRDYVTRINQPAVARREGLFLNYEHRIVRRDGAVRWVSEEAGPVRNDAGETVMVVGMVSDITQRVNMEAGLKKMAAGLEGAVRERTGQLEAANQKLQAAIGRREKSEASLRQRHDQLKKLSALSTAMVAALEPGALSRVIVEGAAGLTGLGSVALYLFSNDQLYLAATHPPLPEPGPGPLLRAPVADHPHLAKALATGRPVILADSRTAVLTGAERETCDLRRLRSVLYLPLVAHGQTFGALLVGSVGARHRFTREDVDICLSLAGNAALALAAAFQSRNLRAILENSQSLISEFDLDGRYIQVNCAVASLFGREASDLAGRSFGELLPPEIVAVFTERIGRMRAGPEPFAVEDKLAVNGKERFYLSTLFPLFDFSGGLRSIGCIALDITRIKQVEKHLSETMERYRRGMEGTLLSLGTLMGKKDNYTAEHQRRVGALAVAFAGELGLEEERLEGIRCAAGVHDLGKLLVPAEILNQSGALSDLEHAIIRTHPLNGYEILKNIDFPWPLAEMVAQHHEKMDGSGYPKGLSGDAILLEARIICVADVVEAMASHRPYRPAPGLGAALAEIERQSGRLYDAAVVKACLALFRDRGFQLPETG